MNAGPEARLGFRVDELARLYGISETVIRDSIARGELPAHRVGKRTILIIRSEWEDYLERCSTTRK